jgi:hypothetical protein
VFLLLSIYKIPTYRLFGDGSVMFNVKQHITYRQWSGMTNTFSLQDLMPQLRPREGEFRDWGGYFEDILVCKIKNVYVF